MMRKTARKQHKINYNRKKVNERCFETRNTVIDGAAVRIFTCVCSYGKGHEVLTKVRTPDNKIHYVRHIQHDGHFVNYRVYVNEKFVDSHLYLKNAYKSAKRYIEKLHEISQIA